MASKRPTAQALLPWSMSAMNSIISLLLVMLWAVSWASMALLIARFAADADEAGLEEREHDGMGVSAAAGVVVRRRRLDQPLALVFLDHAAVVTRQGLELGGVETAAGHDQAIRVLDAGLRGGHRGDDVVDVLLDVDAGFAPGIPSGPVPAAART